MVLLAFSLQDQAEKYGAYVAVAAFFGLAILSLLYFAQAREVKRLREWAGRAPEYLDDFEALMDRAERVARTPVAPAAAPPRQPVPPVQKLSPSVAAGAAPANGTHQLQPAELAALAFARAAGVREPHEPRHHHPEPVAAAAVAAPPATRVLGNGAAEPDLEPAPVAGNGNGNGNGGGSRVPRPATPAARRNEPLPPLPPRRGGAAPRRAPAPAPRRESGMRGLVLTAVLGVIALGVAVFFLVGQFTGDDEAPRTAANTVVESPTAEGDGGSGGGAEESTPTATPTATPTKADALVAVYNGAGATGLAASQSLLLQQDGFPSDNLGTGDTPADQLRETSIVMYRRGSKSVASQVAQTLGISEVSLIDDATENLVANTSKRWDVVVIVGSDKTS
jgi:hypothetical protein